MLGWLIMIAMVLVVSAAPLLFVTELEPWIGIPLAVISWLAILGYGTLLVAYKRRGGS